MTTNLAMQATDGDNRRRASRPRCVAPSERAVEAKQPADIIGGRRVCTAVMISSGSIL